MPDAAFPCHPDLLVDREGRGWKGVGLDPEEGVTRLQARCPSCQTHYNTFQRAYGDAVVLEWIRLRPFAVTATAVPGSPSWQDASEPLGAVSFDVPAEPARALAREGLPADGRWAGSRQLVTAVQPLVAAGQLVAEPGELLLESRKPWVANDRRLALLWSPRLAAPVVAWHSFARLPEH